MAKSKSGGSRAYIRGKLGADVYSIGKDGKGKKQQVVRSLAETVKNPQTINQMRGRMIMSTVMQAQSALSFIVDHSFDGVPAGQPSLSEFIRQNYALIKADVAAHPSGSNRFGLAKYQVKGIRPGDYIVADGKALLPSMVNFSGDDRNLTLKFVGLSAGFTAADFRAALGLNVGDYFTILRYGASNGLVTACRIAVSEGMAGETVITAQNASDLFEITYVNKTEFDDPEFTLEDSGSTLQIQFSPDIIRAFGLILSQQQGGAWVHNKSTLTATGTQIRYTADEALPTYPVGEERFLNGGDL